ncbi:MAG: response regulator transcription factor [Verrucomicrobiota bacterium]
MAGSSVKLRVTPFTKHGIFLVEDHPVTREGFAQLLNFEPDLEVCGQAGSVAEAVPAIATLQPDLVIIDVALGGTSGIELIKELIGRRPELLMLVLSTHDEALYAERSLQAGARGYIMKSAATNEIFEAIRHVLSGKVYLSERMNERMRQRLTKASISGARIDSEVELLTDRELEIFQLIGQGRSTNEIATALALSPSTVATHRNHIQEKLHIDALSELVCRAARWVQRQDWPAHP